MTRILDNIELDYSDVMILPARSDVSSRANVNLIRTLKFNDGITWSGFPMASANMDNLATFSMADTLSKEQILTCLVKHYTLKELVTYFNLKTTNLEYVSYSMGISEKELDKFNNFKKEARTKFVTIDVANGYTNTFLDFCAKFKNDNPDIILIAGNVCTGDITAELALRGVSIIKAGISGGAQCLTRKKTAIGRPMVSTILECADKAHHHNAYIMADGGITCPGDFCIALSSGADIIMMGSQLAGTLETGAEIFTGPDGKDYMEFYGMSSTQAQKNHLEEGEELKNYRASEGRVTRIPYKGSVLEIIKDYKGGVSSCMAYLGCSNIKNLPKKATLIKLTSSNSKLNTSFAKYTIME